MKKKIARLYFSGAIVYGLGILICKYLPYYQNYLSAQTQKALLCLYLAYLICAPFYYFFFAGEDSKNKAYLSISAVNKLMRGGIKNEKNRYFNYVCSKEEKTALLFLMVKLFFLPLMLNFFFSNFNRIISFDKNFPWYPFLFSLMFTLDTSIFCFGYAFEFKTMRNIVRSVEPTFFGWAATLICYPPFNSWVGGYVPWGANDYVDFWSPTATLVMRLLLVFLLVIYTWASFALGTKASNLTNRGIVSRFPYSVVRHPAYISKNLIWWVTLLPVLNWKFALGMGFWTIIYYFRAITEERHLMQDPDYADYCRKVKYRFVPFVY